MLQWEGQAERHFGGEVQGIRRRKGSNMDFGGLKRGLETARKLGLEGGLSGAGK